MTVKVCIKQFLAQAEKTEKDKPVSERRYVPTLTDLAKAAGVSRQSFTRFANNQTDSLNKKMLNASLETLHGLGYDVTFNDILRYEAD